MLGNTILALNDIKELEVKISDTKNGECIHQTQRNGIGAKLREALANDFLQIFPYSENAEDIVAYVTDDGLVLEIPNQSVKDGISNVNGSGAITVELGFTVKNLEYNAQDESESHKVKVAEKEAKAKELAEKKAKKIAKDTAARKKAKGE